MGQNSTGVDTKTSVYHLRIEMLGIEPLIWRRIWVPGNIKLPKLHRILQIVMGWENYHLHQFHVGPWLYGVPDPDGVYDPANLKNEKSVTLEMIAPDKGDTFIYEYDFGDGWEHKIKVEKSSRLTSKTSGLCALLGNAQRRRKMSVVLADTWIS